MHGSSIHNSKRARERRSKISSFVASLMMLAFCQNSAAQSAQDLANKMNTEQKVGQVMIWSFIGTEVTQHLDETLSRYQPGALILFRRNIQNNRQLAKLNGDLQRTASKRLKAPLLLMVDQEGGVVTRIRVSTPIPSALALGKISDPTLVENFAKVKGEMLAALGFNVNLAPVMDISDPVKDPFIGNRTFGEDPESVTNLSMAYARGISASGMIPTSKHFPGHGGTTDSHQGVPKKGVTEDELEGRDLIPFKAFSSATFPRFMMMAHLSLPNIDPQGLPATYSPTIIGKYLREKLGFTGVVVTDDLEMAGAAVGTDIGERAVRAFLAGNDMLMFAGSPRNQRAAFKAMLAAVSDGRISRDRLNESVVRILEAKSQLKTEALKIDERKAIAAARKLEVMSKEVMQKNFKFALENKKDWPEVKADTHAVVFSSTQRFFFNFRGEFKGKSKLYRLTPDSIDGVADELANERVSLAIFYASGKKTARWLSSLTPALKAKIIVVNCNQAGDVDDQDSFLSVLNLNSHSPESGLWLAEELNKPPPVVEPEVAPEELELRTPAGGDN